MKMIAPKPFTFEAGERAVLLLHGFTGNSADVRMLGRFLQNKGYTCHAPVYKGHDEGPESIIQYGTEDWWQDVKQAYEHLRSLGHENIAVCGLSLGGVFSLKLGYTVPIKGIVPMCAPMYFRSDESMTKGFQEYAKEHKSLEGKSGEQIEEELAALLKKQPFDCFKELQELIQDVRSNIDMIYAPTFVVQARNDDMINTESANIIHDHVESTHKNLKWYEESGHVITLDKERDQLHEDVYAFLEELDW